MKKLLVFALILTLTLSTIGCDFFNQPTSKTTKQATLTTDNTSVTTTDSNISTTITSANLNELMPFITALDDFDSSLVYGHRYQKIQSIDDFVIYSKILDLKMVLLQPLNAKLSYYEQSLADFDSENQFNISEYDLYYFDDETIKMEDGVQSSSSEQLEFLEINFSFINLINSKDMLSWNINQNQLQFTLSDDLAQDLLKEEVFNISISITINEDRVNSFTLRYELDDYHFTIIHDFNYYLYPRDIMIDLSN